MIDETTLINYALKNKDNAIILDLISELYSRRYLMEKLINIDKKGLKGPDLELIKAFENYESSIPTHQKTFVEILHGKNFKEDID